MPETIGDKRYVLVNGVAIAAHRRNRLWPRRKLAEAAQVSADTVKRAEKGNSLQLRNVLRIPLALGVNAAQIMQEGDADIIIALDTEYCPWDIVESAAHRMASEIFKDGNDDVHLLTLPGSSTIFAGLISADAEASAFGSIRMHVCMVAEEDAPESDVQMKSFDPIVAYPRSLVPPFKILVPRALTYDDPSHAHKIVVVTDALVSDAMLRAFRAYFRRRGYADRFRFACGFCYEGFASRKDVKQPDIIGATSPGTKFVFPWGKRTGFEDTMRVRPVRT